MTITKAIKTLTDFEKGYRASIETEVHDAILLSIHSLQRLHDCRMHHNPLSLLLLQGEEKEK